MRETNRGRVGLQAVPVGDPGEDPVRDPEGGLLRRHVAPHLSFVQNHCSKSYAKFCDVADPGSGIGFFLIPDLGSQIHIFERLVTNFGEKVYNSLKIGPNFFLQHFKNK
jgi:hypothetical protein